MASDLTGNFVSVPKPRLIAGSGRSGTTWIQDVLAEANDLRTIFEPLHPRAWPSADVAAFRIAGADTQADDLTRVWQRILAQDFNSTWSDYRIRPDRLKLSWRALVSPTALRQHLYRRRQYQVNRERYGPQRQRSTWLIKSIRANLMLDWLRRKFAIVAVHVLRHPGAVVESQLRLGTDDWIPGKVIERVARDPLRDHINVDGWVDRALAACSPVERYAWDWCLDNYFVLQPGAPNTRRFFYEDLLDYDGDAWSRLTSALELRKAPDRESLARPSQQAKVQAGQSVYRADGVGGWRERLGEEKTAQIQAVLNQAGVTIYHVDSRGPCLHGGEKSEAY